MNRYSLIRSVLAAVALWGLATSAMAVTCKYEIIASDGTEQATIGATENTIPLQINAITVGRDVPLGAEVYRQSFKVSQGETTSLVCKFAPFQISSEYKVSAVYPKATWSTGPYAGKVYMTDIPGLGVAFRNGNVGLLPFISSKRPTNCTSGHRCVIGILDSATNFDMILIKIGNVSPGLLDGDKLPEISVVNSYGDANMLILKMKFKGYLDIVAKTCTTPDVIVPLGTHLSKTFTNAGSASGWKDFNIALNNCPGFVGISAKNGPGWVSYGGKNQGGYGTDGTITPNKLQLRIDPSRPAINASSGVLSLDPSGAASAPAATGIGVQIADSAGNALPLATARDTNLTLRPQQGNYSIPLRARYLQTSSQVTPGPANASATFTLIYQ